MRHDVLLLDRILADSRHSLLQMTKVAFIDSTGMGLLIRLQRKMRAAGRQLVLLDPSPAVKRALALMHLQDFFLAAPDFASAQRLLETWTLEKNEVVSFNRTKTAERIFWRGEIIAANADRVWRLTERCITLKQRFWTRVGN